MDGPAASKAKAASASTKSTQRYRFSHFFKAFTVDFDRGRGQTGADVNVEWKKPDRAPASSNLPAAADFDELTFKRSGDENMNITINLYRDESPPNERFELSPELAEIVDMKEGTRPEIIMGLWEYIKLMGLQEDEEKRNFRCDELLRMVSSSDRHGRRCRRLLALERTIAMSNSTIAKSQVIGRESGYIPLLHEYIQGHLRPLPPVKLPYTIRVDEEFHKNPQPTVYDIRVLVDDPLRAKLFPFIHNPQYASMLKEVAGLDDQLATLVQAIAASKSKHSFLASMSNDPAIFIRQWLSSQKRDLEVIMGEATRGGGEDAAGDEWRRGGRNSVWTTQNARESVNVMLSKAPVHR